MNNKKTFINLIAAIIAFSANIIINFFLSFNYLLAIDKLYNFFIKFIDFAVMNAKNYSIFKILPNFTI